MSWFHDNFWKLFDGIGGSFLVALISWALVHFSRSEPPSANIQAASFNNSPVASGSGNIQTPIQIHSARDVHIGHSAGIVPGIAEQPKPPAVATGPNIQFAGQRTKEVFISPVAHKGFSDPSEEDERKKALHALVLKFENRVVSDRKISRAMNVIARMRFSDQEGVRARSIDYGIWLNSGCNSTEIGVGDTRELVLLCLTDNELISFDDRRIGNRFFPPNFSYFEHANFQGLEVVEITIIDQSSQSILNCKLRVWLQGSSFCVA